MVSLLLGVIYLAFISLGLPDALLGAAWPTMSQDLHAPVSWAGGISMVISAGTIISALLSDRMTLRWGAGRVTVVSVAMTAFALAGFSIAPNYWTLVALAIPYGLGAGGVDAALNNYVAVHYESRHMSWLHCMWGVGASVGPYIMGYALQHGQGWPWGYRYIAIIQVVLTIMLVFSLPLWKGRSAAVSGTHQSQEGDAPIADKPLGLGQILAISGAKEILVMFFCYCAIESTAGLWASSYLVLFRGVDRVTAASWASLFYVGITIGRFISGFMTMRWSDPVMIRIGQAVLLTGVLLVAMPTTVTGVALVGLVVVGLGCAPIYPCVIHSTPAYFGADKSQAIVGVQMASAYIGSLVMPPVFGVVAQATSIAWYPAVLGVLLVVMVLMHEGLRCKRATVIQ